MTCDCNGSGVTRRQMQKGFGAQVRTYPAIFRCWCAAGDTQSPTITRLPHPYQAQEPETTEFYPVFDDC